MIGCSLSGCSSQCSDFDETEMKDECTGTGIFFWLSQDTPALKDVQKMSPPHVFWLAVGGGLGTLARAGVTAVAMRWLGRDFPWGTLAVNLLGSFLFGLIAALGRGRVGLPAGLERVVLVGFLGGFTTYSSFSFQSVELLQQDRLTVALAYLGGTVVIGLLAVWSGLLVGRSLGA